MWVKNRIQAHISEYVVVSESSVNVWDYLEYPFYVSLLIAVNFEKFMDAFKQMHDIFRVRLNDGPKALFHWVQFELSLLLSLFIFEGQLVDHFNSLTLLID